MTDEEIWKKDKEETHNDIHVGVSNDDMNNNTILFSIGHRCTSASMIKQLNLKFESYPFDWVVSKLEVVLDCVETNFEKYLNPACYSDKESETFNITDGEKRHVCFERIVYNNYYETKFLESFDGNTENNCGTYGMMLSLTHHDIRNQEGIAYFQRCVNRFNRMLALPQKKYYLYIHPLIGAQEFEVDSDRLLHYLIDFVDRFKRKATNLFGIFFIVVKNDDKKFQVERIFETMDVVISIMYVNNNLIDAGGVYDGDFFKEQSIMLNVIENVINTSP